ncbi:hypothetical protein GQ53DRAFT_844867 [Thozetella sp. PMI_491]|nr:hypothetical protein GQ53DRAFT_844867 [Thozetella sp. PMI_491]
MYHNLFPLFLVSLGGFAAADINLGACKHNGDCITFTGINPNGGCYYLSDGYLDDVKTVNIPSGYQCTFWEGTSCNGDHTNALKGSVTMGGVCVGILSGFPNWDLRAASYKCCPNGDWCAGKTPSCSI